MAMGGVLEKQHRGSISLFNPAHLDGFEHALTAMVGIIVKVIQRQDPLSQIGKADRHRIDIRVQFRKFNCQIA
ncbi:hypothetical protein H744_2c3066 [Photobacterium gaetbulicola Gung47]|uniref:Uncharacterized protein n=1 Tax=Photobacterium gaetbulicola Gung47 TaxID=658445 RepID=A0A0C5WTK5_9GAMM|nr:hypothetical protein H744_2c3066 [Photobacterium gaetbulicola Gung47]